MKYVRSILFGMILLFLIGCSSASVSKESAPLVLKLEIAKHEVQSFSELKCQVTLTNQSTSGMLVNRRLFMLPYPAPSSWAEMLILISDSHGNYVDNYDKYIDYPYPSAEMLKPLGPGEQIEKKVYQSFGIWPSLFKKGETYTIVVVYQNNFDVSKVIDGVNVPAWVGAIQSNEETFSISP